MLVNIKFKIGYLVCAIIVFSVNAADQLAKSAGTPDIKITPAGIPVIQENLKSIESLPQPTLTTTPIASAPEAQQTKTETKPVEITPALPAVKTIPETKPVETAPTPVITPIIPTPEAQQPKTETKPTDAVKSNKDVEITQAGNPIVEIQPDNEINGDEEKKDIYLNFENADLSNFVNYIAEIKKLNLIVDKGIEAAKVSLSIREPLSVTGAWNIFLTVLEMGGFSIIKSADFYKVVPRDKKLQEALPVFINVDPEKLPNNDLTIRYVMFLTNIQIAEVEQLLASMLSQPLGLIPQKEVNGFIITDKSLNIRSAAKLLRELDASGLPEAVTVVKLKQANAKDIQDLLVQLIKKPEGSPLARLLGKVEGSSEYFSAGTRIIVEERTNSLILLGNAKSNKKIEDFVKNHVDTELKEVESPLHIYELQNTDATQVAEIIKSITAAGDTAAGQTASKYGSTRGGVKFFRPMVFSVDKEGNRLLVSSIDKQDWKLLKKTLKDLDKPQPQVAIETLIVTVTATDVKGLSGAVRNKNHGQIGTNVDAQSAALTTNGPSLEKDAQNNPISLLGSMLSQLAFTQGTSVLTFGKANGSGGIWGAFQALQTQSNASILSQPFVTVSNKAEAQITVGTIRRVVKEELSGGTKGYGDNTANTLLKITPQINLDGVIRMDLSVKIEDFLNDEGTNRSLRNLETKVTVADGQVLVLGGFIQTKVNEAIVKTPVLGSIPVLGWFFKSQKRTLEKTYIFIFMRPTIVKPRQMPGIEPYTKFKLHDATDQIEDNIETKRTHDPIHNWFFNPENENYSHKVIDFANARYQPTTVDIKEDPYYRSSTQTEERAESAKMKNETDTYKPNIVTLNQPEIPLQKEPQNELLQKQQKLKEILSADRSEPQPFISDPAKRNKLKEFLQASSNQKGLA
jgi:general secretion pathway protein D